MTIETIFKALPTLCSFLRWLTGRKPMRCSILVIEDSAADAMILEHALRRLGYECEIANSAEVARGFISRSFYSFIFVDLRLPGLSGEALLRVLSDESPSAKLVIVCGEPADLRNVAEGHPIVFIRKNVTVKGLTELFKLINGTKP
jgi:DNA-binding NtrC family response regulator